MEEEKSHAQVDQQEINNEQQDKQQESQANQKAEDPQKNQSKRVRKANQKAQEAIQQVLKSSQQDDDNEDSGNNQKDNEDEQDKLDKSKGPRGRPPGAKNKPKNPDSENKDENQEQSINKSRGRPTGVKNKYKQEKPQLDENNINNNNNNEENEEGGPNTQVVSSDIIGAKASKRVKRESLLKKELERENWPSVQQLQSDIQGYLQEAESLVPKNNSAEELKRIYKFLDLTSLNNNDTWDSIETWLNKKFQKPYEQFEGLVPAAVCVYSQFSRLVRDALKNSGVKTAVVSTNFPTGQTYLDVKVAETKLAIKEGANEIDMVVNRGLWNDGTKESQEACIEEIIQIKKACGLNADLKVILENSELKDYAAIYKLSYLSLCAGANFIKTSTGKSVSSTGKVQGAELDQFAVMCIALRDFSNEQHDDTRGIKAAGGIKDILQSQKFIRVAESILKTQITADKFRIGASSLADFIITDLAKITPPKQEKPEKQSQDQPQADQQVQKQQHQQQDQQKDQQQDQQLQQPPQHQQTDAFTEQQDQQQEKQNY